jgi:phage protein U
MASIGQIGDVIFEYLRGPEELTREMSWSYAEHEIAGSKSVIEYTGEKLHKVKLKIKLSAVSGFWSIDPQAELITLEDMARGDASGPESHPLIIGTRMIGYYVIEKIKEGYKRFNQAGSLISCEVELDLKEYK